MTDNDNIFSGKRILAIDDNPVILKSLCTLFASKGCDVLTARDRSEVIARISEQRPDLILLDILFSPDPAEISNVWDGFSILEWLRKMGNAADVPVIVISGADPDKHKNRCLAEGVRAFFPKPIPAKELLEAVHAVLKGSVEKI
jgi:CheY-like chemotaxis protein